MKWFYSQESDKRDNALNLYELLESLLLLPIAWSLAWFEINSKKYSTDMWYGSSVSIVSMMSVESSPSNEHF